MANNPSNGPVRTYRDGAVFSKVWRNQSDDGRQFYSVTFGRTYTDPQSGEPREAQTFQGTDVLKVQQLSSRAYDAVTRLREKDREAGLDVEESNEKSEIGKKRDADMGRARRRSRSAPAQSFERDM